MLIKEIIRDIELGMRMKCPEIRIYLPSASVLDERLNRFLQSKDCEYSMQYGILEILISHK